MDEEPNVECPQCHRTDGQHKLGCGDRHTPTDDEREALIKSYGGWDFVEVALNPNAASRVIADLRARLDAALRRSEVPEPSATPRPCHLPQSAPPCIGCRCEPQGEPSDAADPLAIIAEAQERFRRYASQEAPNYDDEVDALLDISRILYRAPRTKREPSEAQINAAQRAISTVYISTATDDLDAYGWDSLYREMAVAALRAASQHKEET